jgi:hypothetical protein
MLFGMTFGHGSIHAIHITEAVQRNLNRREKQFASAKSCFASLLAIVAMVGCLACAEPVPTAASSLITATPSAASFGSVPVDVSNSQTVKITNNTTGTIVLGLTLSGTGFTLANVPTDRIMAANTSLTFNVVFAPTSAVPYSGSVSWSNGKLAAGSMTLTGSGIPRTSSLSVSTSTLTFGNELLNDKVTLPVIVVNRGNVDATISTVTVSGKGFSASGVANGTVLLPNQTGRIEATFDPTVAGASTGKITITSSASNIPTVSLSGTGVSATQASVSLRWTATANALGYYVFRGSKSGGPYSQLSSSVISTASYVDSTVQRGQSYFYVVTSLNTDRVQSSYSNQAEVSIPSTP